MVELIEVVQESESYRLKPRSINPSFISDIYDCQSYAQKLQEGKLPVGLNNGHKFSYVHINRGGTAEKIIVVGSVRTVQEKLQQKTPNLLFG